MIAHTAKFEANLLTGLLSSVIVCVRAPFLKADALW